MEIRALCALGLLIALLPFGTAFAQQNHVTVETDDTQYVEGDTIAVSGSVAIKIGENPVLLQIIASEGNRRVHIDQISIALDGSYSSDPISASGELWSKPGQYTVRATYLDRHIAETTFSYSLKPEIVETSDVFENIDAGSHGTFDVPYKILGGTVSGMAIDFDNLALVVDIEAAEDGHITVSIPREYVGATKADGADEIFIVYIDGAWTEYTEQGSDGIVRTITFNFEKGASEILIIGTYALPEFGPLVIMAAVAAGMVAVMAASRGRLGLAP